MSITPSFSSTRQVIRVITQTYQSLRQMIQGHQIYVAKVKEDADRVQAIAGEVDLKTIPVEELTKAKQGIRVAALRDAGITNLYEVHQLEYAQLEAINGIGPKSAENIIKVMEDILQNVSLHAKIILPAQNPNPAQQALIRDLYYYRNAKIISYKAEQLFSESHVHVEDLLDNVQNARNWFRWTFSSTEKKNIALSSLQELMQMMTGKYPAETQALVRRCEAYLSAGYAEYMADFVQNAASYYATLDNLRRIRLDGMEIQPETDLAIRNGMSPELAIATSNVSLNLTGLSCELRAYQRYGVQFIVNQGAVLLGDEMGLGKTVEAIASMIALRNIGLHHFIVVCPASVLINWVREVQKFSDLTPYKLHGKEVDALFAEWINAGGVAITTYETLGKLQLPEAFSYDLLIVDEAHYVKNPSAARTQNVMTFRQRTSRALFMTGTPIENDVDEMCFLVQCLQPQIAGELRSMGTSPRAGQFRHKVAPVYFRRTKEDVLSELPEKVEIDEWCTLVPEEEAQYLNYVAEGNFAGMRQVSFTIQNPAISSKALRLCQLVQEALAENKKIIVFSYFINTIAQIQQMLGPCYGPITGSIQPAMRQEIIDAYSAHDGGAVLLSQIQAGGTGLNIQAASVIIFCEPQLKPSIENQAMARAYRMGQVHTVFVHHLLCDDTVDERIVEILRQKQAIFDTYADISESGKESIIDETSMRNIIATERGRLGV